MTKAKAKKLAAAVARDLFALNEGTVRIQFKTRGPNDSEERDGGGLCREALEIFVMGTLLREASE